jgi:3-dehydroquinate synthetase
LHGEAIAIGMCVAFRFSQALGSCSKGDAERVAAHFQAVGLPTRIGEIPGDKPDAAALFRLMGQDKKVRKGKLTFILARGIGSAYIAHDVAPERVSTFLEGEIAA